MDDGVRVGPMAVVIEAVFISGSWGFVQSKECGSCDVGTRTVS